MSNDMRPLSTLRKNSREVFHLYAGEQAGTRMVSIRLWKEMPDGSSRPIPVGLFVKEEQVESIIAMLRQGQAFLATYPAPSARDTHRGSTDD